MQINHELRWDDLRVVLALQRQGSLKQAAVELGINISTVSRRLDALEELVGVHLFDRSSDGTRPTAAAELLLPFAETMERAAHGFTHELSGFELEAEGVVRITAPPGLVDHFLAPAFVDLIEQHPRLRLQVVSSIGYADLTRHEADIALRIVRPASGDFIATRLATSGWLPIASPAHAKALGRLRDPQETRWITWGEDLSHLPDAQWISRKVARERVVLETSSMSAQLEAVRAGLGVMLAPLPYAQLPGLTELQCTPAIRQTIDAIPESSLWLVGHRALRDVPRIAAVWSWIKAQLNPRSRAGCP